ncbi:MAG: DUF434 domain-containing protein [Spirochaetota bacterium]
MEELLTTAFKAAIRDYSLLIEKEYPQKAVLKLIGDRYALNSTQRIILYRGIVKKELAAQRRRKAVKKIKNSDIYVDCYNVLFTIANYLYGRILYISRDGFLRDAGEIHGKKHNEKILAKSIELLLEYAKKHAIKSFSFFIDSPVAFSGELKAELNKRLMNEGLPGEALVVKSPDFRLKNLPTGIIATSDSIIIDNAQVRICDIARMVLQRKYKTDFVELKRFL